MGQTILKHDDTTLEESGSISIEPPTAELVRLNREIVESLLLMAGQSGDAAPLKQAVTMLRNADDLYGIDASPKDNADLLKRLGDTLFNLGSRSNDAEAIAQAINAYRSTITIASMLGESALRRDTKSAYQRAMSHQASVRG